MSDAARSHLDDSINSSNSYSRCPTTDPLGILRMNLGLSGSLNSTYRSNLTSTVTTEESNNSMATTGGPMSGHNLRRDCGAGGDYFQPKCSPGEACNPKQVVNNSFVPSVVSDTTVDSAAPALGAAVALPAFSPAHSEGSADYELLNAAANLNPGSFPSQFMSRTVAGGGMMSSSSSYQANYEECQYDDDEEMERINAQENGTNIIINYLPPTMTQEEVRALFSRVGEVDSCKLVRDKVTGESLGYAFVNYSRPEEASTAIRTLNGLRLQNKFIKVSKARPSSEAIKGANLYISGLPKSMSQVEMEKLFQQCGRIITARILHDNKTGVSRGVAFIRYDQRCEAEAAILRFDGYVPPGAVEPIAVKFANTPGNARTAENLNNLLLRQAIQQLNPLTAMTAASTPAYMNAFLNPIEQFTALARLKCAMANTTPASNDVWSAVTAMNPLVAASSGALTATGWSIFIYNLAPEVDEAAIWQLFGPFGAVQNVKIVRDPATNKCRGYGFVSMSNYEEALLSIQSLNGFTLNNRVLQVSFKTSPTMNAQKVLRSIAYLGLPNGSANAGSVSAPQNPSPSALNSAQLQETLNAYINSGLLSEVGDNLTEALNLLQSHQLNQQQAVQVQSQTLPTATPNLENSEPLINASGSSASGPYQVGEDKTQKN